MAGALSSPGPGRFARPTPSCAPIPRSSPAAASTRSTSSRLPALSGDLVARVAAVPGVARAVGDLAFPAGAFDAAGHRVTGGDLHAHAWDSAALTPYTLQAGHAPRPPASPSPTRASASTSASRSRGRRRWRGNVRVSGIARAGSTAGGQARFLRRRRPRAACPAPPDTQRDRRHRRPRRRPGRAAPAPAATRSAALRRARPSPRGRRRRGRPPRRAAEAMVAIFGDHGRDRRHVALFVVAGTFGLAIAQRQRESAVLRALGATPRQVRRLIAGEALFVSTSPAPRPAGRPPPRDRARAPARRPRDGAARLRARPVADPARRRARPRDRRSPSSPSWPPPAAPARPARPRRCARSAVEHARPGVLQIVCRPARHRRRRRDVDHLPRLSGHRRSPPRRDPAGGRRGAARPRVPRDPDRPPGLAAAAARRLRHAREHRPGRQPLADGGARLPARADRHAGRQPGPGAELRPAARRDARPPPAWLAGHVVAAAAARRCRTGPRPRWPPCRACAP